LYSRGNTAIIVLKILATTVQNLVVWHPKFVHPCFILKCKGKGKVSAHATRSYGTEEVKLHPFLTSALDGDERTASCPFPDVETQILISNPELHYQPTFLNSMWFDDATGAILESGCGTWRLILGNRTHWEENVKFLATKHVMYLVSLKH
jgi:hypothetical protein